MHVSSIKDDAKCKLHLAWVVEREGAKRVTLSHRRVRGSAVSGYTFLTCPLIVSVKVSPVRIREYQLYSRITFSKLLIRLSDTLASRQCEASAQHTKHWTVGSGE